MKKLVNERKLLILLCILCSCLTSQAQQLTHQITFNINDVEISDVNGYDMVRLVNGGYRDNEETAGEPQLPLVSINLLLPEGAVATSVTVSATQETQITGSFTVYPVHLPAIPDCIEAINL